jgi:arylsulfatase
MVVSWPARIKEVGGLRSQFTHLIDIVPTILEVAGIPAPQTVNGIEQKPLDGVSIASTFSTADAKPVRQRQYFEVFSNRAIYDQGWIACAQHTFPWRQDYAPGNWDKDTWELYHLDEDFSEDRNLAAQHPEKVEALKKLFDDECKRYNVLPLDDRGAGRLAEPKPAPGGADPTRRKFTYYPGAVRLAETAAPNTKNRSHRIDVAIEKLGDGVLLAEGGQSAGFVLYVKDGKANYHYNFFEIERTSLTSTARLPPGRSTVSLEFRYDGGGAGKGGEAVLLVDGSVVASQRIERTVAGRFGIDTFGVGCDTGSPVCKDYKPPFAFQGSIKQVDIALGEPGLSEEDERVLQARFHAGKNY